MGALLALQWTHVDLNVIALIGIILLIGIVKKKRDHDDRLCARRAAQSGLESHQRHLSSGLVAIPTDHDDYDGRAARRRATSDGRRCRIELRQPLGITIIGGLIFSQMLTLYTTPVIYLWFEKLLSLFRFGVR